MSCAKLLSRSLEAFRCPVSTWSCVLKYGLNRVLTCDRQSVVDHLHERDSNASGQSTVVVTDQRTVACDGHASVVQGVQSVT